VGDTRFEVLADEDTVIAALDQSIRHLSEGGVHLTDIANLNAVFNYRPTTAVPSPGRMALFGLATKLDGKAVIRDQPPARPEVTSR
jgi:hypothetical protein